MRQMESIQQAGPKVHGRFVRTKVYLIFTSATSRQFEGASKSEGQSEGGETLCQDEGQIASSHP